VITTNLNRPKRRWYDLPVPLAAAICVMCLLCIAVIIGRMRSAPAVVATPTPGLIILFATPQIERPIQVAAVRYVVAFDQPNGTAMGPMPAPSISAVLARYGDAWVLVPWESGRVWVRAADVGLPDVADLQPTVAPQVVYEPVYQPAPDVATPETTSQVTTSDNPAAPVQWATSGPIRAEDFTQPDRKASCAFLGCLGTK